MNRYVVLYCAPKGVAARFAEATPEDSQAGLQRWVDWAEEVGPALIDPGKPLGNAVKVTPGALAASDTNVIGMSILQASSLEEAVGLVADHHHLEWSNDCEIIVLEEMAIPELA